MKNFWQTLPRPFFVLAPMADVTDAAFRRVVAKYSKIGHPMSDFVMYTEFVSADGLCLANKEGKAKLLRDLQYSEEEHPIVAQFFTAQPGHMERAAALAQELGFDGVDINMGCPDRAIEKQGAGARLMQNPRLARELIVAAKRGAPKLPISVKTRLGYNKDTLDEWLAALLKAEPAAIAIHARTRREMSATPARWERITRAVEIRNDLQQTIDDRTLIVGNGNLIDIDDAKEKIKETGADGAMLGRAVFGNPALFSNSHELAHKPVEQKLNILVEHTKLFEELLSDVKSFAVMKKHFRAYIEGFDGAKELRVRLMEADNAAEVEAVVKNFISYYAVNG